MPKKGYSNEYVKSEQLQEMRKILKEKAREYPPRMTKDDCIMALKQEIIELLEKGWNSREIAGIFREKGIRIAAGKIASLKKNNDVRKE